MTVSSPFEPSGANLGFFRSEHVSRRGHRSELEGRTFTVCCLPFDDFFEEGLASSSLLSFLAATLLFCVGRQHKTY